VSGKSTRITVARLLLPELRWDPTHGYAHLDEFIDESLEARVGGFVIAAGPKDDVAALTASLHDRSDEPLLIAAEAEAGAGSRFHGLTALPPAAALGALHDADAIRRAAKMTARELHGIGVNWALAPVADLARSSRDPLLGSRSFGDDAQRVAEWVVEWVDACQSEGVLAGVKHYPGIGRAIGDPTLGPVTITDSAATIWADDLLPFRGAVDAGAASLFAAPVAFTGLDGSGAIAAHSSGLLRELLRDELHFDGIVAAECLRWRDARVAAQEPDYIVSALAAGCDLILTPADLHAALEAVDRALDEGTLDFDSLAASRDRRDFWADWGRPRAPRESTLDELLWARQVADTVIHPVRGIIPNVGPVVDVSLVDDDAEQPGLRPSREYLGTTIRALGLEPRFGDGPTADGRGALVIALFGEPGIARGRSGYQEGTRRRVAELVAAARQAQRPSVVLQFGPPRLATEVPEAANLICCWSGERAMQEAAARRLL
jgi:beta-glucosidase-like glycosyl hydrolase